jgi:hypothetical protein
MRHYWAPVLILFGLPAVLPAQETPEDLLPMGTQVYLRWDGIEGHRPAYEKTALGKMLKGDSGKFLSNLYAQAQDSVSALLLVDQVLQGFSPDRLIKLQADAAQAPKLLSMLAQQGFVLAAEARKMEPLEGQATLILPSAGNQPGPLLGTLRLIAGLTGLKIKESTIDGQVVHHIENEAFHVTCFIAGKHQVLTLSTDPAEAVIKHMQTKGARLTSNPLFQRVRNFNQFETAARAFVDAAALVKIGRTRGKDMAKLLEDLGLDAISQATLYSGFDGDSERGLMEVETNGQQKGLLATLGTKPFKLADVPPLPEDVTSWSIANFDMAAFYDVALATIENGVRLAYPEELARVRDLGKQADDFLGVDIRKELLGSLENLHVMYSSPSDGPLNLGQTFLIKVKDGQQLQGALSRAIKGVGRFFGVDVSIKKRPYHGVDLREVHVRTQGFFFVPAYAIHKDWLAFSYFPQPVQGYILRATGELPSWKPDAQVQATLNKLPRDVVSLSMTDPRPTIKQLAVIGPLISGAIKSFFPDTKFEVGTLPNGHEATRHLFPNVSVVTYNDKLIRHESRSSLDLPIDLAGLDGYLLLGAFYFFAFLF